MSTEENFSKLNLLTSKGMEVSFEEIKSKFSLNEEKILLLKQVIGVALEVQRRTNVMCKKMGSARPEMWIAGGVLRDILLMQKPIIKDIDIFVEFPFDLSDGYLNNNKKRDKVLELLGTGLSKNDEKKMEMQSFPEVFSVGSHKKEMGENSKDSYLSHAMIDIIKLKSESLLCDVELIVTPTNPDRFIFESFDFSFCKCAIKLPKDDSFGLFNISGWARLLIEKVKNEDSGQKKEEKIAKMVEQCLESSWAVGLNFMSDVLDKKISFEGLTYTSAQAEYSLKDHYERIYKKYPDYRLTLSKEFEEKYNKKSNMVRENWGKFHQLLKALQERQGLSQEILPKTQNAYESATSDDGVKYNVGKKMLRL